MIVSACSITGVKAKARANYEDLRNTENLLASLPSTGLRLPESRLT